MFLRVLLGAGLSGSAAFSFQCHRAEENAKTQENDNKMPTPPRNFERLWATQLTNLLNQFQAESSWNNNYLPSSNWDFNWDRREPQNLLEPLKDGRTRTPEEEKEALSKLTPKATRHIFLIRHGQYDMVHSDDGLRKLTALGRKQAELTGNRLNELGHNYDILIHSTMQRAQETAEIISALLVNLKSKSSCDLLREGAPCPPEPPVGSWKPESQQFYKDWARIEGAYRKIFHRADPEQKADSFEVVVCHANVIRYFVCRALQFPPEAWLRFSLHNGSITWVIVRPSGRIILKTYGDAGYMPPDCLTTT